jgi:hypothetical protein
METTTWDQSEFDRALLSYLRVVPHSLAEVLNKKALYLARGALRLTPKASRAEIEALGIVAYQIAGKTGRRLKRVKAIYNVTDSRARRILISIWRKRGELAGKTEEDIQGGVKKFLAARLRSIAFLSAGWIPAIRAMARKTGEAADTAGVRAFGRPKGRGTPASDGWDPVAVIENSVRPRESPGAARAAEWMRGALEKAFAQELASMQEFILKRLQRDADRVNAR